MKTFTVTRTLFGFPLTAAVSVLNDGVHVLLTGGCRTHVGAVTLAEPGCPPRTLLRQSHRDDVLSTRWATALADALQAPVCVACGVHYDNATPGQIRTITAASAPVMGMSAPKLC